MVTPFSLYSRGRLRACSVGVDAIWWQVILRGALVENPKQKVGEHTITVDTSIRLEKKVLGRLPLSGVIVTVDGFEHQ